MITDPMAVLAALLVFLALLFAAKKTRPGERLFRVVPLLVFAYFVPAALSNTGVLAFEPVSELYDFVKDHLLPASLVLLTLSVDVPAIVRLGRPALILFATGTASIVLGGPIAYLLVGSLMPEQLGEQTWRGLAALSGSWIGGGANFVAIGESVGLDSESPIWGTMIVVDVAVASVWMAVLLYFAGREREMDARSGADRTALEDVRGRVEGYRASVARPTTLADLLALGAIGLGVTAAATALSRHLPELGEIVSPFTWVVILATTAGLALSFTRLRRLEGAGSSALGSTFLYLLVATIGANADLSGVLEAPGLLLVGAVWMSIHALAILAVWRLARLPIFFAAVGSQANVGGAASAPIVAAAFHPALAPVGVLLGVAGYVVGTYAALGCAFLLEQVAGLL